MLDLTRSIRNAAGWADTLGAERTENAAVARIGAQQGLTVAALVEELADVRGHAFLFGESTMRARQDGLKNNVIHSVIT